MRIAFLSTFYPFRGGIAQFNADLYTEFAKHHEVKAFTFTRQYPDFLFPGRTQYVTAQDKAVVIDSEAVLDTANPFNWTAAARKIAAWKPDVLVMKYWMSYLAPSLGTVARKLRSAGIPVITVLDNVIPHEPKFFDRPFSRWFLRQNSACVAMSRSVLADMLSLAPDKPYVLQPHPLYDHFGGSVGREEACGRLGISSGKRNLLFFGLIRDYKGLDLLIDAMSLLGDEYQLLIAGESYGDFEKYENKIAASSAKGRIKVWERYIGDDEVPLFFSVSDLCVLPYRSATQSGITAIAMHFCLPLVATPVGGLEESIAAPGFGLVCNGVGHEALARSVQDFFAAGPEGFRERISEAKKAMTWEAMADSILSLLQSLS